MFGVDQKILAQTLHRYRTLEVELAEATNAGQVSSTDFQAKRSRLQNIQDQLNLLHEIATHSQITQAVENRTIELPILSDCSRLEQRIIHSTLMESGRVLKSLADDSFRVLKKVQDIHAGRRGWIRLIIYLSWQRTRIRWTVQHLEGVRAMRQRLEGFIKHFSKTSADCGLKGDLVDTFREFEETTSRIARLKVKLHRENAVNIDQERWIKTYESRRKLSNVIQPPPIPAEFVDAKSKTESPLVNSSETAKERLVIANRLIKSLSGEDEHPMEVQGPQKPVLEESKIVPARTAKKRVAKKQRSEQ